LFIIFHAQNPRDSMRDLTLVLNDILNNESLKNGNQGHQSITHEAGTLHNGLPGEDDQFGSLKRPFERQSPKKVESIDEFEFELLEKLSDFHSNLLEFKVLDQQIDNIRDKLKASKRELAVMLSDDEADSREKIKIKYELLTEEYERLGEIQSGKQHRKQKEIKLDLTQTQIVILFNQLKNLGMVGKNVSNTILAACISEISGFSKEKIRQALSNIHPDSDSIDSDAFTENDFHRVKNKVEALKKNIQEEIEDRF
jgi:hypothetical protein